MEPNITGSISAKYVRITNAAHDRLAGLCGSIGVKVEQNRFYAKAEGGFGTLRYAAIEGGKDTNFGESPFGLNTSVGAQDTMSSSTRDYYKNMFEEGAISPPWKLNDKRAYGNVALTYTTPKFEASLGARGGVKSCVKPSLDGITLADVGQTKGTEYACKTTKTYIEPAVSASINLGDGLKASLQTSRSQGEIGISYTF